MSAQFNNLIYHGILENMEFVGLELLEFTNICTVIQSYHPNEFYNLVVLSFVSVSLEHPIYTTQVDALDVRCILEALRKFFPDTKFYQASTSEMFGLVQTIPQLGTTSFNPSSPYGVDKLNAHWLTVNYKEVYNMYTSSEILFNHESPIRGSRVCHS